MPNLAERINKKIHEEQIKENELKDKLRSQHQEQQALNTVMEAGANARKEELLHQAGAHFNHHLMPIFVEIAKMKGLSIYQDPYENRGFLGTKTKHANPQQGGFCLEKSSSDDRANISGRLIWGVTPEKYDIGKHYGKDITVNYKELFLSVDNFGWVECLGEEGTLSVNNPAQMGLLDDWVVRIVARGGIDGKWETPTRIYDNM